MQGPVAQAPPPDAIRAALRDVFASRTYVWDLTPDPWKAIRDFFLRVLTWLDEFGSVHPLGRVVLIATSLLLLGLILAHASYVVYRLVRVRAETGNAGPRIPPQPGDAFHLAQAYEMASEGRYREAISHRFLAAILRLDRRRIVRYHGSKTPAEYLRERSLPDTHRELLRELVTLLYRYVFGGTPCGSDEWDRFDRVAGALA